MEEVLNPLGGLLHRNHTPFSSRRHHPV